MSSNPVPNLLWALMAYCAITSGWLLLQDAQQPVSAMAAQLEERTIEVGIRVTESLQWLDPNGNPEPELTAENLAEMAQQALAMSEDPTVAEEVQDQARLLWILYGNPPSQPIPSHVSVTDATAEIVSSPPSESESTDNDQASIQADRARYDSDATLNDDYLTEESAEGTSPLRALIQKMSEGYPIVEDDLIGLRDTSLSPWLRRRLHAQVASNGEPISADSSHAHAEQAFMGKLILVFAGMAIMGLLGLGLLIAAPFMWKRIPLGLGVAGPAPFVRDRWGGWLVFFSWLAFYLTLPLILQMVGSVVPFSESVTILMVVVTQVLQGLFALWAIGTFGMADQRIGMRDVLGTLRMGLQPFQGNPYRPLYWGLGGYAAAIPLVFVASLIQLLLPFDNSIASGPVFQWLLNPPDTFSHILIIAAIVILAPFFEEILFRGFLYRQLRAHLGVWKAILVSAAVFSLMHMSLGRAIPLFALGAVLALVKERSGGLMPCILLHAFWNGATILQTVVLFGD